MGLGRKKFFFRCMLTKKLQFVILWMLAGTVLTGAVWLMSANQTIDYARNTGRDAINRVSTKTDIVHGNDDRNNRLHIVYEIYAINSMEIKKTLKYGITSQKDFKTKTGNPRPESQVRAFRRLPEFAGKMINYTILYRNIESRFKAKSLELMLVNQHYIAHGRMPQRQFRPIPTEEFIKP